MSLEIPFGITPTNPVYVEAYRGPYDTVAEALSTVPQAVRVLGQVVFVEGIGEYWWKDSVADAGLIEKTSSDGSIFYVSDAFELRDALDAPLIADRPYKQIYPTTSFSIFSSDFPTGFTSTNTDYSIIYSTLNIVATSTDFTISLGASVDIYGILNIFCLVGGTLTIDFNNSNTFGFIRTERVSLGSDNAPATIVSTGRNALFNVPPIKYELNVSALPPFPITGGIEQEYWKNTNTLKIDDSVASIEDTWSSDKISQEISNLSDTYYVSTEAEFIAAISAPVVNLVLKTIICDNVNLTGNEYTFVGLTTGTQSIGTGTIVKGFIIFNITEDTNLITDSLLQFDSVYVKTTGNNTLRSVTFNKYILIKNLYVNSTDLGGQITLASSIPLLFQIEYILDYGQQFQISNGPALNPASFTFIDNAYFENTNKLKIDDSNVTTENTWSSSKINTSFQSIGGKRLRKVESIIDATTYPLTVNTGDRYILGTQTPIDSQWGGGTANQIAEYNGASWDFITPEEGNNTFVDSEDKDARFVDDGAPAWELESTAINLFDGNGTIYDPINNKYDLGGFLTNLISINLNGNPFAITGNNGFLLSMIDAPANGGAVTFNSSGSFTSQIETLYTLQAETITMQGFSLVSILSVANLLLQGQEAKLQGGTSDVTVDATGISLNDNVNSVVVSTNSGGDVLGGDYVSNLTANNLITKAYLDLQLLNVGGVTTGNGIEDIGSGTIGLGGALTQNTTIDLDSNELNLTNLGVLQIVSPTGAGIIVEESSDSLRFGTGDGNVLEIEGGTSKLIRLSTADNSKVELNDSDARLALGEQVIISLSTNGARILDNINNNFVVLDQNGINLLDLSNNEIILNANGIRLVDNINNVQIRTNAGGVLLEGDYTANLTANNLITKAYLDLQLGNISGDATNLSYVPSTRELQSSTGNNVTLPLAVASGDAGLITGTDMQKLDAIEPGAQANVQPDWDATSGDAVILNKPATITTGQASEITANTLKNSYPSADATKLSNIENNAQVNVQPDWNATSGDAEILNKPTIPPVEVLKSIHLRTTTPANFRTAQSVVWDLEDFKDSDSFTHSTTTSSSEIELLQDGLVEVDCNIVISYTVNTRVVVRAVVRKNGVNIDPKGSQNYYRGTNSDGSAISFSTSVFVVTGDKLEVFVEIVDSDSGTAALTLNTSLCELIIYKKGTTALTNTFRPEITDAEVLTKFLNNSNTEVLTTAAKVTVDKLSSTESPTSVLNGEGNYVEIDTLESLTSLSLLNNILSYTDEDGTVSTISLSQYVDTNAAVIQSGVLNTTTGIVTFTKDDNTTFTLDLSGLLSPEATQAEALALTETDLRSWSPDLIGQAIDSKLTQIVVTTEQEFYDALALPLGNKDIRVKGEIRLQTNRVVGINPVVCLGINNVQVDPDTAYASASGSIYFESNLFFEPSSQGNINISVLRVDNEIAIEGGVLISTDLIVGSYEDAAIINSSTGVKITISYFTYQRSLNVLFDPASQYIQDQFLSPDQLNYVYVSTILQLSLALRNSPRHTQGSTEALDIYISEELGTDPFGSNTLLTSSNEDKVVRGKSLNLISGSVSNGFNIDFHNDINIGTINTGGTIRAKNLLGNTNVNTGNVEYEYADGVISGLGATQSFWDNTNKLTIRDIPQEINFDVSSSSLTSKYSKYFNAGTTFDASSLFININSFPDAQSFISFNIRVLSTGVVLNTGNVSLFSAPVAIGTLNTLIGQLVSGSDKFQINVSFLGTINREEVVSLSTL